MAIELGKQYRTRDGREVRIYVKPRIQRTVWVNVYRHDDGAEFVELHDRRDQADGSGGTARVACVKLTIDCEEGEGL